MVIVRNNLGSDDGGGEELGGSKRSERPEAEPGEKGESQSRSMSIGEEPLADTSKTVFGLRSEIFKAGVKICPKNLKLMTRLRPTLPQPTLR